jgi:hypothetical protein
MLICIRALDYCPPVDLTFGDYLRALVTADVEYSPEDEEGLRFALLESFRSWGIVPDDINTYSIESLMWQPIEECTDKQEIVRDLKNAIRYVFEPQDDKSNDPERTYKVVKIMDKILRETNRYKSFQLSKQLGIEVHNMFDEELGYYKKDMETLLGMKFGEITFNMVDEFTNEEKILIAEQREKERVFQVYRCRPIIRHNDQDGISSKLLIITFLQKVYVSLEGSQYQGYINAEVSAGNEDIKDKYAVRGGATLIIDLANYEIKYAIIKNITSTRRLRNQLDYAMENLFDRENAALLMQSDEPFAALHLH